MYKLCFFVPEEHAAQVKMAVFEAGAGKLGDYEQCSWETSGIGQFKPSERSQPFIGQVGRLERVPELKVEILCSEESIASAVEALLTAHPYEAPAYEVFRLAEF